MIYVCAHIEIGVDGATFVDSHKRIYILYIFEFLARPTDCDASFTPQNEIEQRMCPLSTEDSGNSKIQLESASMMSHRMCECMYSGTKSQWSAAN